MGFCDVELPEIAWKWCGHSLAASMKFMVTVGAKEDSAVMEFNDCVSFLVLWVQRGYEDCDGV